MMTNIENKKSEALSRMITLGLHPKVMQKFQNGVLTCSELTENGTFLHRGPTAEELVSIGAFQKEHNCLVYYAIKTHTDIGTMLALLYVSDNVEERLGGCKCGRKLVLFYTARIHSDDL